MEEIDWDEETTDWDDLSEAEKDAILAEAREEWLADLGREHAARDAAEFVPFGD